MTVHRIWGLGRYKAVKSCVLNAVCCAPCRCHLQHPPAGGIFALPSRGFELLPGMLPPSLQGLTLVVWQGASLPFDADGSYTLSPGCFPQGLTSLKCRGFCWERPGEVEPWSPWFGWEFLPAGLRQLELDAEAPCLGVG